MIPVYALEGTRIMHTLLVSLRSGVKSSGRWEETSDGVIALRTFSSHTAPSPRLHRPDTKDDADQDKNCLRLLGLSVVLGSPDSRRIDFQVSAK